MRKLIVGSVLTILAGGVAHYLWRHRNDQEDRPEEPKHEGNPLLDPIYRPSEDPPQELFEVPETFEEMTVTLNPNTILDNIDEGYKHIRTLIYDEYWFSAELKEAIIDMTWSQFIKLKRETKSLGIRIVGLERTADALVTATADSMATQNRMMCVHETEEMIKNTVVHYVDKVYQSRIEHMIIIP